MKTIYKEKRNYTYKYEYQFTGYGLNAEPIYLEYETKFNIANGVKYFRKFTRYVTENGKTYNSYIR